MKNLKILIGTFGVIINLIGFELTVFAQTEFKTVPVALIKYKQDASEKGSHDIFFLSNPIGKSFLANPNNTTVLKRFSYKNKMAR